MTCMISVGRTALEMIGVWKLYPFRSFSASLRQSRGYINTFNTEMLLPAETHIT